MPYYNKNNNRNWSRGSKASKMTNGPGRDLGVAVVVAVGAVAAAAAAQATAAAAWLDKHLFNMTIKTSQTAYAHAHTDTHTATHTPFGTLA